MSQSTPPFDRLRSANRTPIPVTWFLLAVCVANFAWMVAPSLLERNPGAWLFRGDLPLLDLMRAGGLVYLPVPSPEGMVIAHLTSREPFRLVSAVFVHVSALHLVVNGLSLVSLGRAIETRFGSGRFAIVFVVTGLVGYVTSEVYYRLFPGAPGTAGASGALFGLIGALAGYLFARRDPKYRALLLEVGVMALAFAVLFSVNNAAHVGGLIAGFPLGIAVYRERAPWKRETLVRVVAVILVTAGLVAIVLAAVSPMVAAVSVPNERFPSTSQPN